MDHVVIQPNRPVQLMHHQTELLGTHGMLDHVVMLLTRPKKLVKVLNRNGLLNHVVVLLTLAKKNAKLLFMFGLLQHLHAVQQLVFRLTNKNVKLQVKLG
jgi:hypothetical protein